MPSLRRRAVGLYKQCKHLWDRCDCPWWGQYSGKRVSLRRWTGRTIENKVAALAALGRMRRAIDEGNFDPARERPEDPGQMLLRDLIAKHLEFHVAQLRSNTHRYYAAALGEALGSYTLNELARSPLLIETWLRKRAEARCWSNATFNRHYEYGRALFNRAKRWRLVTDNPFTSIERRRDRSQRMRRITPEQEQKLLDACLLLDTEHRPHALKLTQEVVDHIRASAAAGERQKDIAARIGVSTGCVSDIVNWRVWNPALRKPVIGPIMRRRLIAAMDLGVRAGEMLKIQVKHVDYDNWLVRLPAEITKAGKDQIVFAMTPRIQDVLLERRALGPDAYVFGGADGKYTGSFAGTWRRLFHIAGLPTGRKQGYVWHDLRHEYGSWLVEQGGTIQEVKELMRHADISTTARYLTANRERLRELAQSLARRNA